MSKAAKKSIYILIALLVFALGFAWFSSVNLKGAEKELEQATGEYQAAESQFKAKEKQFADNTQKLK